MTNIETIKQRVGKRRYEDNGEFYNASTNMRFDEFLEEDVIYFKNLYLETKDIGLRDKILGAFVLKCLDYDLKDFFLAAFKKERYLDMRLTAIRGYATYVTEKEVEPLMKKFLEILIKIPSHTPYNYKEYETLRSSFGLPYLVKKYNYACFKDAFNQLEKQYDDMPIHFKGYFTLNESGMHVSLMTSEEIDRLLDLGLKSND